MADKIDALFSDLQSRGFAKDKTNKEFRDYMLAPGEQGYKNRKAFFEDFKSQGLTDLGTYEDFKGLLGLHAANEKPQQTKPYNPAGDSLGAGIGASLGRVVQESQRPINPNLAEDVQRTIQGVNEGFDQFQGNLDAYYKQNPLGRGVAKGKQRWNQDTGEFEQTYLTGAGTEHTSQREAEDIQKMWVGDERTQLRKKAEFADDELERALAEREKLRYANPNDPKVAQAIANNEAYIQQLQRNDTRLRASEMEIDEDLADIRRAEEENTQRRKDAEPSWWDTFRRGFAVSAMETMAPMGSGVDPGEIEREMSRSGAFGSKQKDITKELDVLRARRKLAEDAKSLINDIRLDQKMEGWGLARAGVKVAETALNPNTWDWGKGELETDLAIAEAVIKADSGLGISDNERKLLDTWAKNTAIQSQFGEQLSGWTKAGMVTGESLPFMLEMAMNPASGLGKGAMEKVAQYASKKAAMRFLKEGIEKFGKEEGEKWAKRKGAEYLRNHMKGLMAKKIATRAVGDITGAEIMASTSGSMRVMDDAIKRYTGDVDIELADNGDVYYKGIKEDSKDNPTIAVLKALGNTGIENWSEMAGEYMGFLNDFFGKAIGRAVVGKQGRKALDVVGNLEGVSLNKAQKFIYELAANKGIGAFSEGLGKFAKQTQWHGVVGEYLEEVIGNIANAATVGDMTFDTAKNTGVFNLQQNIDTFCGVALMGGFMSALHTGGFIGHRIKYSPDRVSNANAQLFGEEQWNDIKAMIDNSHKDPRELNDALTYLLRGKQTDSNGKVLGDIYNNDEKKAILKYTQAVLEKDGADMVNYKPRMYSSTLDETNAPDGKKQYVVTSLDKYGNAISKQAFNTEDEAQAYEGELKMQQQQKDYQDYLDMSSKLSYAESADLVDQFIGRLGASEMSDEVYAQTMADINDPNSELGKQFQKFKNDAIIEKARANQEVIAQFEQDMGWEQGTVKWLSEQDPMQMDNEGLEMMDTAREFLEGLAYPAGEVHIEHEQQKGAEAGQSVVRKVISLDEGIDPNNNEGQQIKDQFQAAEEAYNQMLANDKTGDIASELKDMEDRQLSPQEILSSLETFTPQQRQIVADYYNAKARWESYVETAANEIDSVAHRDRERRTFKGTINGQPNFTTLVTVTDEDGNSYNLVSGKVEIDSSGNVTDSDSGLIIAVDANGNFVQLNDKGLVVTPIGQSLNDYEAQRREELQQQVTMVTDVNGTLNQPAPETTTTGTDVAENVPQTEETGTQKAIDRIPKDEGGNPLYEQASPEDTYDALVEQTNEQTAKVLAQKQLDKATKKHAELKKKMEKGEFEGNTLQEQIENSKKLQQAIDAEQERINYWNKVLAVPNNRLLNNANNQPATTPPAGETPPTPPAGGENNVPDWSVDKASDARARGYRMTNGHRVNRQNPIAVEEGNETEVKFDKNEQPTQGKFVVAEAGALVPSHVNGQRNVLFFIDEAQPKDRTDVDSEASSNRIAEKINPEEITGGVTAYTGSPVINERGEVIQGNNRTIGLQKMWGNASYEESQKKYKQYLIDHAAEFGLDPAAIEQMQNPVLVRMVDVTDEEAIRLGQKTAANTESGGVERIDPMRTIQSMGDNIRVFMNLLFGGEIEGQTLMSMIADRGVDVLKWLNDGRNHPKYISDTQYQSCFDKKGNLTEEAKTDLRKIVEGLLFADAPDRLPEMFYSMPTKAQNAILATFWRDAQSPDAAKILKDIQESIEAFAVINGASEQFRSAKDVNAARTAVKDLQKQTQLFGNETTVLEKFSNFALELAIRYKGDKQNNIRDYFNAYYDAVQGKGGNLFETATTKTKEEAIKDIFGIETNNNTQENGQEGSNTLGNNGEAGETGESGSEGESGVGEQVEGGEQPATGGTGSNGGTLSAREQYIADHPLTVEEINAANASEAQKILARQYLNLNNEYVSEMAKAAYTYIYNKKVAAQSQGQHPQQGETRPSTPSRPATEAPAEGQPTGETPQGPTTPPTPPTGGQTSAQEAAKAKMAAALAKLKKHGKKNDQNIDQYSVEKLTPEQLNDMFEVLEAGAELGYTFLDTVKSKEEWINQMREMIGEPLKDATGYTDAEVTELLNDMWNYPYEAENQTKTVGEWAQEKGINVNKNNNEQETNGNTDVVGGTSSVDNTPEGTVGERPVVSGAEEGESGSSTNSGTSTTAQVPTGRGRSNGNAGRGRNTSTGKPNVGRGLFDSPEDTGQESPANDTGREFGNNEPGNSGGQATGTGEPTNPVVGQPERIGKKQPLADIAKEKAPYQPSSIGGKFAIGSVIPSGIADAIAKAFERLKKVFKKDTLDFVREELGYKSNEEMLSDFESGKTDGLAAEQVDAIALAIKSMKEGKSFIVGDMTGVGKGRTAAALIRWGILHGKKVVFVTEKSGLFSDMYRDLTDIGSNYMPFVTNSDTDANITDADGNKVIPKPSPAAQKALWQSESDKLPTDKKGKQYDFVMTTYSQVSSTEKGDQKKKEWLKNYANDAIVIMDESHNASGESNTGKFFRDIVQDASGVTFLSATYAKRPDNMLLYAIKSSMSKLNMSVGDMLQAIKDYGVAMQELMASYLFGSGEMIRRERDMTGVNTTWTDPKEIYSEEEYDECRKTSDKTMALVEDIIQFQRDFINPIVREKEKEFEQQNKMAALIGANQTHASNTAYKSQVSNIVGLMVYAMKAKKAAEMAIEQIKQGKKPVIAVDNTMESYIRELGEDIPEVNFRPIFEKGIRFSLKYMVAQYEQGEDGKYHKIKGSEVYYNAEEEGLDDDGMRALENLRQRVEAYFDDTDKIDLSLSPIDLIKKMIADAGYSCGEITGRSFELEQKPEGGYTKKPFKSNKKEAARRFNGGSSEKPIPENEQYQALILNVAGATGISLHSSKKFGNQQPRTMIILQPAKDVNIEVQMRGRIDRTGQVHRGEYFYVSSPIPAEQKIMMMLKQKLASLDAQSVGTKEVSSNKVEGQDMDNKYGDEVCKEFLLEHLQDINAFLEDGLQYNNKTREWEGRPGLLYDVLKNIQRMPCETQEMIINELTQRYADKINYLNQNGINDLETTTMDLEAVTIDKATFVKGKDNDSENEFEHDTTIERVEVNVLKKPMRSSDIKKKMKDLDALDEDGLPKEGVLGQTTDKAKEAVDALYAEREAKYAEKEQKHEEKLRKDHPKKADQTDEEYEQMIQSWPSLLEMKNKDKADLMTYGANLQEQYNNIYKAAMYLKPGRPYLVPLTDDVSGDAPMMYGRFLGFQMKNGDPRQVQAVFAVKDSRSMITIPVVNQFKVIEKIINERNDMEIVALQRNPDTYEDYTIEQRAKVWDEWWDKMIPKNTNRQIRYMITGNVVQACGSLGKYKGQIVTFTRKNKETGEITLERGMLLAENFDPENFQVRRAVTKKDVWDSYNEIDDERSGISVHRDGSHMVIKFNKRKGEKLKDHPAQSDETLKGLIMNGELRPSKKDIVAVVKEENVEKALEHLYKEYGYTREELFVMPDSTEKPDAIVHTNRPYKEIIEQYKDKYGGSYYTVDSRIRKMLKRYKMDVNNDTLAEEIKEAVMLRQAYLRQNYANMESNRLAWRVLIQDGYIERYKEDKEERERYMRIKEAMLEELEYRGFKGNTYHYTQGKITTDDVKKMFNAMNDESTPEGKAKKALFDKVMAKVEKLPMEIIMNETIDNDTGGWAGGRLINYNWKYMNADYISDQAKADTILHELIHTVTAYADHCVERGEEHLLDQDMIDAINELHSIFEAIKNDPTFVHEGEKAYGLTNVREMLSEAGSNSEFRNDLKKTGLWARLKAGFLAFFGIKPNQDMPGAKKVNAYEQVMERLEYLIENFKQEAWEEFYKGTQYGGFGYQKADAQKISTNNPMEAIEQASESWKKEEKKNKKLSVEEAEKRIEELSKKYKPAVPVSVVRSDASNEDLLKAFFGKELIDRMIKAGAVDQIDIIAKNLRASMDNNVNGKNAGGYVDLLGKIVIFADRLPARSYEEAYFHENIHAILAKMYGGQDDNGISPKRPIAERLWNDAPDVLKGISKETIEKAYAYEDDYAEEFLAFALSRSMVDGNFDEIDKCLNGEDKKTLNKILKELGYERRTETKERREGLGETQRRESEGEDRQLQPQVDLSDPKAIQKRISELMRRKKEIYKENGIGIDTVKLSKLFRFRQENVELSEVEEELNQLYIALNKLKVNPYVELDPIEAIMSAAERFKESRLRGMAADVEENSPDYSAKKVYHDRIYNRAFVIIEAFQDAMLSLKNAINAIARDKDIPDSQNPYMAENLMHGKVKNQMDDFNRRFKDPLMDTIKRILKATGMNYGDIDRYVYTKSGLERNRELFVRDWLKAQRSRTIRRYEQLNEQEQEIYKRSENSIITKFEDGDITEEQKNKMLKEAVQEAHDRYINDLEQEWLKTKREAFDKLNNGELDYKGYLIELMDFIQSEIDGDYDPNKSDYSGFRDMFGDKDGKYDEANVISQLESTEAEIGKDNADTLWDQIRAANRYSLERYREAGMRTDEQINKIEQMFNFYVPMRGFAKDTGEDMYQYMTNPDENGVRHIGGLLKNAKGRKSEAEYPIATMFAMAYKAISDCEQNLVNQKLYRLCQAHPNDLIVLSDAWAKYNEQTQTWEESMPDIPEGATEEEARRITLDWESEVKELAKEGKAKKIKGTPKFDYMPRDPKKKAEHIVEVRMNGQKKLMTVVGNPRLAKALNGQLRFKGALGKISSGYARFKNFMANTFTSWSPTFAMRNMWRDWTHFRMMLSVREGEGYAKAANKYYKETLPRPYHGKKNGEKKEGMVELFKKYRAGTLDMSKEVERDFQDFMDNGGTTGFVFMQKLDELQKEMENLTKDMDTEGKIKVGKYTISFKKPKKLQKAIELNDKVIRTLFDSIEAYNEAVENNARFATFRASRHYAGRTKSRSAYDAKEITVNFNRKGAGKNTAGFKDRNGKVPLAAQVAGATAQTFGEGRVFFNATLQAIATTFKNFRNPDGSLNKKYIGKWAARYASIPFAFGFMMPIINNALASFFGGGDDDDPYANLPDWVRRNNICFYIGHDNFITIPIGQELAAFLALGDIAAGLTYKPNLLPVDKDWLDEVMGVLNTFSPVEIEQKVTKGGLFSDDFLYEATGKAFSVLTPIISVAENRSWTGRQIYKEDMRESDKWIPEYQKAYSGTNPLLMSAAKGLHELGGGNERKRGKEWTEWNPGKLQYLWEQYTGGPGKTLAGLVSTGRDVIEALKSEGEPDFNIKKVEGVKAFVQQGDDRTAFYRTKAKFNKYEKEAQRYGYENDITNLEKQEKAGDPAAKLELERLKKGVDFTRFDIIREANRQSKKDGKIGLDDFRSDMYKMTGKERKEAEKWYNNEVKELVDRLDNVGEER